MNECIHDKVTFKGLYSMIGNYFCDDCGKVIDPLVYHHNSGLKTQEYSKYHRASIRDFWNRKNFKNQ